MSTTVETRQPTSQPARTERSGSSQFTRRKMVGYLVTLLTWVLVFLFFFPVLWMIVTSFKTEGQAASFPPQFFFTPTLENYAAVFDRDMGLYLLNSLFVAVLSTIVVMLLAIPAAYALSVRPIGRWQDALFFFISTKFMPVAASIIPVFLLLRTRGTAGQPVVARAALPRHQPATGGLDDALVLLRGTDARWSRRPRSTGPATTASCGWCRCPSSPPEQLPPR